MTSGSIIHMDLHKSNNKLIRSWNTFGAWTSHGHTRIHKIHHGLDLGEVIIFLLIIFSMISHRGYIQMSFCPRIPKLGISKLSKLRLLTL
jgi:hypothetical protein